MDLRTKLVNARKRKAKLDAREARMGLYRLVDEQVCIAIYIVSGYDMGLAIEFVQQRTSWKRRKKRGANWVKGVADMFLRSGITVKAVLQPESGDEIRVTKRAVQWLAEEGTREWVTELNFEIGTARQKCICFIFVVLPMCIALFCLSCKWLLAPLSRLRRGSFICYYVPGM